MLLVLDVSDPGLPELVGEYETPGYVWKIFVAQSHVFIANGEHGFMILRLEFN